MGAGATSGGSMDASNLLKPALSSGRIRIMGSTTHEEYRKFIEKDSAFSRRFQKVDVDEPSKEHTYQILMGLRSRFEEHHGVKYSNAVLKSAVELSVCFSMF
jgi:ATP-dependent Clp protease ATP-binding subunit ClpA